MIARNVKIAIPVSTLIGCNVNNVDEYECDNEEVKGYPVPALDHQEDGPVGFNSFSEAVEWWKFSQKHFPQEKASSAAAAGESVYQ